MLVRFRHLAALTTCAVLASACGSTAQTGRDARPDEIAGTLDTQADADLDLGAAGVPGPADDGRERGTERVTTGAPAPGTDPIGGTGAVSGQTTSSTTTAGPGEGTTDPVSIGFWLTEGSAGAAAALGFEGFQELDERKTVEIYIEEVNRTGGLAGRPIEPVFHITNVERDLYRPPDQLAQEACSTFTEDNQVFAAGAVNLIDAFYSCLEDRGVVGWISGPNHGGSTTLHERWPHFHSANGMLLEAQIDPYLDALVAHSYFAEANGVGLITDDSTSYRRTTTEILLPEMQRRGLPEPEVVYAMEASGQNIAALNAQMSNAVLRFRTMGIDHVFFLLPLSGPALLFMQNADSQGYRPRYGVYTGVTPQLLTQLVPASQLEDAVGMGFHPPIDAHPDHWLTDPVGRTRCLELLAAEDITFERGQDALAMQLCDLVFYLRALADTSGQHAMTPDGFLSASADLGTSFVSASVQGTRFAPGRRWGGDTYQLLAYDTGCACFRYTSEPRRLSP